MTEDNEEGRAMSLVKKMKDGKDIEKEDFSARPRIKRRKEENVVVVASLSLYFLREALKRPQFRVQVRNPQSAPSLLSSKLSCK